MRGIDGLQICIIVFTSEHNLSSSAREDNRRTGEKEILRSFAIGGGGGQKGMVYVHSLALLFGGVFVINEAQPTVSIRIH